MQLASVFGAQVTAVDAAEKLDLLRDLGADRVVDYARQDFTRMGERYDLVLDIVSQAPFADIRRALEPDGTFVLIGHDQYGRSGHRVLGSLRRMLPLLAASPFVTQLPDIRSGPSREANWATLLELLNEGRIRPVVDERTSPWNRSWTRSTTSPPAPRRAGWSSPCDRAAGRAGHGHTLEAGVHGRWERPTRNC